MCYLSKCHVTEYKRWIFISFQNASVLSDLLMSLHIKSLDISGRQYGNVEVNCGENMEIAVRDCFL